MILSRRIVIRSQRRVNAEPQVIVRQPNGQRLAFHSLYEAPNRVLREITA